MLNAYLSGDKELYKEVEDELKDKGLKKKKIISGVKRKAKERYLNEEITEKEAKEFLNKKASQSDEEVWTTLKEWNSGGTYKELYKAIDNSMKKGADREKIFNFIREAKDKGGKKDSDIATAVTNKYKKKYLEAKKKGKYADMKNLLISVYMHLGYTQAEANKKIDDWSKIETE